MKFEELAKLMRVSTDIVFFTGAGISTESGVPDYRSPQGIWSKYKPVTFQEFQSNYEARIRYWRMKCESYLLYQNVKPNLAHESLVDFEKMGTLRAIITQNVDGLHRIAGSSEDILIELHGTDRKVVCLKCGDLTEADDIFPQLIDQKSFTPPTCEKCDGILKPATISFGQHLPDDVLKKAEVASENAKVFIVLGSSLQVHPAAALPVLAKRNGATLVIANKTPTPEDSLADFTYRKPISEFFRDLASFFKKG